MKGCSFRFTICTLVNVPGKRGRPAFPSCFYPGLFERMLKPALYYPGFSSSASPLTIQVFPLEHLSPGKKLTVSISGRKVTSREPISPMLLLPQSTHTMFALPTDKIASTRFSAVVAEAIPPPATTS